MYHVIRENKQLTVKSVCCITVQYLLILTVVLSNTIWTRVDRIPITQASLTFLFGLFSLLLSFLNITQSHELKLTRVVVINIVISTIVLMVSIIPQKRNNLIYLFYVVFPMLSFELYYGSEDFPEAFWKRYVNVVTVLCLVSLVFYLIGTVFRLMPATSVVRYKWGFDCNCNSWFNIYYESYYGRSSILDFLPRKNTGLYPEPPMYMIVVGLAIAAEMSFSDKPRRFPLIIEVITLISIMSTTGLLFLVLIMVVLFMVTGRRRQTLKVLAFPVVVLIAIIVILEIFNSKYSSLTGEESMGIHIDHMMTAFKLWLEHPVFGIGYGMSDVFERAANYHQGASIGLPLFLAYSGLWTGLLYFIPLIRSILYSIKFNGKYLYFVLGSFFLLFTTSVNYLPIMFLIFGFIIMDKPMNNKFV